MAQNQHQDHQNAPCKDKSQFMSTKVNSRNSRTIISLRMFCSSVPSQSVVWYMIGTWSRHIKTKSGRWCKPFTYLLPSRVSTCVNLSFWFFFANLLQATTLCLAEILRLTVAETWCRWTWTWEHWSHGSHGSDWCHWCHWSRSSNRIFHGFQVHLGPWELQTRWRVKDLWICLRVRRWGPEWRTYLPIILKYHYFKYRYANNWR